MDLNALFSWSIPFYRTSRLEVRIHWSLLLVLLFTTVALGRGHEWLLLGPVLAIELGSVWVHALAHVAMARLCGGSVTTVRLWALGESADCQIPLSPGRQAALAVSGMVINLVIGLAAMSAFTALHGTQTMWPDDVGGRLLSVTMGANLALVAWNLIPASILDGGRLWRAVCWPFLGLSRAVRFNSILAIVAAAVMTLLAVWEMNAGLLFFGILLLFASVYERRSIRAGYDPVLPCDLDAWSEKGTRTFLDRWREQRRRAREQRQEREEASEQEVLDRLLAKVTEHGLPALTEKERSLLQRISKKQRERQETGAR